MLAESNAHVLIAAHIIEQKIVVKEDAVNVQESLVVTGNADLIENTFLLVDAMINALVLLTAVQIVNVDLTVNALQQKNAVINAPVQLAAALIAIADLPANTLL